MADLLSERYYYIYSLIEEQDTSDVKTLLYFYTGTNTGRFVKTDRSFIEVDSRVGITVNSKAIIKTNGGASLKLFIKMNGRIIGKNPFIKIKENL